MHHVLDIWLEATGRQAFAPQTMHSAAQLSLPAINCG
jgi:hypothetical protein